MGEEFDVDKVRDCLLKEIAGCYNCQPWESQKIPLFLPDGQFEVLVWRKQGQEPSGVFIDLSYF
jgi:hypothetical protein